MHGSSTIATLFVQSLATIIVIVIGRRIDMFERESWKSIAKCSAFGVPTFTVSTIAVQALFHIFCVQPEVYTLGRTILLLIAAGSIQILCILIALYLWYVVARREFDTLSDYILYSTAISAGYLITSFLFQYSLTEINSLPFRQETLNAFYIGPAFMDSSVPFLSAGIGIFLFLIINKKSINSPSSKKISITVLIITICFQALFLTAGMLLAISNKHTPSQTLILGEALAESITIMSVLFSVVSISVGAVVDFYLISSFVRKVSSELKFINEKRREEVIAYLSHPASYSRIVSIIIERPKSISKDARLTESIKQRIAKLALISWKQASFTQRCIDEATQAIKDLESSLV